MWRTRACRVGTPADTMAGEHRSAVAPRPAAESQVPVGWRTIRSRHTNGSGERESPTRFRKNIYIATSRRLERLVQACRR
jgi:hypothetical protein